MLLLVDNYDSFVHNLARYFQRLGQETLVVRNDAIDAAEVRRLAPTALVLSPGPCGPEQAGNSLALVSELSGRVPILGVCLGHQTIAAAFGGRVIRARRPVHGQSSLIDHVGRGIFAGLPRPLRVGRYHSLIVEEESLPACLEVTARSDDQLIMALAHRDYPVVGVQFHPESILTERGYDMLAAFLALAGAGSASGAPLPTAELAQPVTGLGEAYPHVPITF